MTVIYILIDIINYKWKKEGVVNMEALCYEPKYTSYRFVECLFAALVNCGCFVVDMQSLVEKIYIYKHDNPETTDLFEDIEFRKGPGYVVSDDIESGICCLQTFNEVGKINPRYEKLIIFLSDEDAEDILKKCDLRDRNFFLSLALSLQKQL